MKNPLNKRMLRELRSEMGKYAVIAILLIATIGFVSGFLVAGSSMIAAYNEAWDGFEAILPISAHSGDGLSELMAELQKFAAPGPQLFPDGETSDQPERQVIGEILREKMLLCLDKEIPHGAAVEITKFSERDSGVVDVDAVIYCEKASHKGIIIGKQGAMLKKISSLARHDMEKFMGTKIYLETWVKVKENWRENAGLVRTFGYDE